MKSRNTSTKSQKMTGSFQLRSAVENKRNITTFTDFLNFLHTCEYFLEQIYQHENIEKTGLGLIKGKVLYTKKAEFAKNNPTLPGLDQVEKYLKFVTLPIEDENGNEIEDADGTVITIDEKHNPSEDGKPVIGVNIYKWIEDHRGLADNSTHSKNITYKTQNEGYQIARGQHTRAGLIDQQPKFSQGILQAKLDNALMGAFFTDSHSQVNVRGTNFSYLNLRYSNFNYALAEDTQWNGTDAQYSDFRNIILKNANLSHASFCNADFRNAKMYRNASNHTEARGTDFSFADMRYINADRLVAKNAIFKNTNAEEIELQGADLENADFSYAILKKAKFYRSSEFKTNINNANFSYANVSEADFGGTDCINANFAFAIAHKINFVNCISLKGSSFEEADLKEANIFASKKDKTEPRQINLSNTNFKNANLADSNLGFIDFSGAILTGANLTNVMLHDISFKNADLSGVNFENVAMKMVDITPKQLATAININTIRHIYLNRNNINGDTKIYTTYDELCKLDEKQLIIDQKFFRNLITEALNIQKEEKQNLQTAISESETQQEQSKNEDVVVIKEGKQEINVEKSIEEKLNSNANTVFAKDHSDETVKRLSRKKKMKQKVRSELPTPPDASVSQHGIFSQNTPREHFMQRYQNTIKGICVTLLGLGCVWTMNFIAQQSEDHPKNMTNFNI